VARAAPDGNTLLVSTNGMAINAILRKVNFDPLTSFEPVCYLVQSPQVIVVNSASPYRTLAELVAAARAKPAELSIASVGPNSTQHLAIERLKQLAGINLTYVPYTGGAPAINALLGGHVTAVLQNYSEIGEQLRAGKLRALATPSAKRIEPLPDLPTVAESGYKDFAAEVWFGLVATGKTPKETVSQLAAWFRAALQAPDVKAKLLTHALYPNPVCGDDFAPHIRRQSDEYRRVIGELGIKGR
jgi:tripartite-type tricarboxylate transporter receptor subunit TctC